jgi:hypothetical protein
MHSSFNLDGTTAVVADAVHFDLHNNYDFIGYEYHPSEKLARFDWRRGKGEWVPQNTPVTFSLLFDGVSNLAAARRDDEQPFSEDSCLAAITFLPSELNAEFGAVIPGHRSEREHLSLAFMSGAGIKIWSENANHEFQPV